MRRKERFIAAAAAAMLSVALTWPIAARLGSAGRLDSGDGRVSVWYVAWIAHALTTDPLHVYDANIFSPHTGTLAYSESNLVAGVLGTPAWVLTRNPYAAANFALLAAFFLSAYVSYLLGRHLTRSRAGGAMVALGYAFCPFAFAHLPHIQLLMTFGPALALLALHRLTDAPSSARGIWLGLALAVQALACAYYGIFGSLAVALGFIWFGVAVPRLRTWRYWRAGLLGFFVATGVLLPFFLPYLAIRGAGFARPLDEARLFSATWRAYLASAMPVHAWMQRFVQGWRDVLFPGFLTVALAVVAAVSAFGRRDAARLPTERRVTIGFYLVLLVLAVWASLGPAGGLYTVLFKTVPLFSFLRAPSRFGVLATLSVAVLAGFGLATLIDRAPARHRWWIVAAALAIALAESTVGPLDLVNAPPVAKAYRTLAQLPRGVVVEFPFFHGAAERSRQTEYMLMLTLHWMPLVNGYSDFLPDDYVADAPAISTFPGATSWAPLRQRNTRYVLLHWDNYPAAEHTRIHDRVRALQAYLLPIVDDGHVSLFEIVAWPDAD